MYADPHFDDLRHNPVCFQGEENKTGGEPETIPPPYELLLWYAARGVAIAQKKEPIPGTKTPYLRDWLPCIIQIIRRPGWLTSLQTYAGMAADMDAAPQSIKDCLKRAFDTQGIEEIIINQISESAAKAMNG